MPAFRGHGEERVESHHSIDLSGRYSEFSGNDSLHGLRKIAVIVLALMQDVDQLAWFVSVLLANSFDLLHDFRR